MALRVPTVDGPSVAERPLEGGFQRSSVSPGMLSNPLLGEAGKALLDVGMQMQERQDADELMRAETEVKSKYLEWEAQAKQRKGQQAWGVAKEAGDFWDTEGAKAEGMITSPRAKAVFQREVMKNRALAVGALSGHEAAERRASLTESAQASIVSSINMAAANPSDPEIQRTTKDDIVKRTAMLAQLHGWAPEMADAKRAEYLTNFHKQVLQALVRDHPEAAEAYFNTNKGEIEGSQHAEVGAFAAKATATRVGEAAADAAWQALGPRGDRDPVQLDKLEQSIRDRKDIGDEAKKSAIAALKERTIAFKDARKERDEALEAKVNQALMNGAGGTQIRRMPEFLSMDGEKQRRIVDFIENRALRNEQRAAAQASRAAASEVREQNRLSREGMGAYLIYSNPDTLAGMSENQVLNLLPSLGNELTSHLMQQKRSLANPGKLAEARMDEDDFKQVAQSMGLRPFAAKSEEEKASLGALKFRVEQVISAAQQGGKKVLTRTEKMELMQREIANTVKISGWWSDSDVPVINLTPEQKARVVVPPADRRKIVEALREKYNANPLPQYEPTEANVINLYLARRSPAAGLIPDAKR